MSKKKLESAGEAELKKALAAAEQDELPDDYPVVRLALFHKKFSLSESYGPTSYMRLYKPFVPGQYVTDDETIDKLIDMSAPIHLYARIA